MKVTFSTIRVGNSYSRQELASLWGYASYHAFAKGVFTPRDDNKIILFITEEKQASVEQYEDKLRGDILECDGPTDHRGDRRILDAQASGDEIHLFYRKRHHSAFAYIGRLRMLDHKAVASKPTRFKFTII